MDTIKEGRFADTNAMFVKPEKYDYHVTTKDAENWASKIIKDIKLQIILMCWIIKVWVIQMKELIM